MKKLLRLTLKIGMLLLVLIGVYSMVLQWSLHRRRTSISIPKESSLWMHRGLYDNKQVFENTIPAFDSALHQHLKGIELDIFYVDSLNDFVVTHDMPNKYNLPTLRLTDILQRYGTKFYYWLDLKNLNSDNQEAITLRFKAILSAPVKEKVYIESGHASALGYLTSQHFQTLFWVQYERHNLIKGFLKKLYIHSCFWRYHYTGASIGAVMADEDFFKSFDYIPQFVFHIYTPAELEKFKQKKNTSVHLIDFIPNPS